MRERGLEKWQACKIIKGNGWVAVVLLGWRAWRVGQRPPPSTIQLCSILFWASLINHKIRHRPGTAAVGADRPADPWCGSFGPPARKATTPPPIGKTKLFPPIIPSKSPSLPAISLPLTNSFWCAHCLSTMWRVPSTARL